MTIVAQHRPGSDEDLALYRGGSPTRIAVPQKACDAAYLGQEIHAGIC